MLSSTSATVISLGKFFINNFPSISWYPYWYLGNPYHYLTGPVLPFLALFLNKLAIAFSIGYICLLLLSVLCGGIGIFYLFRKFNITKSQALIAGIIYLIFPAMYLILIYQNGLKYIVLALIPYILICYYTYLKNGETISLIMTILISAFTLLISSSALLTVSIALFACFLANGKVIKRASFMITLIILLTALSLSSIWYTFDYWWILLTNPSIGGIPLFKLFWNISAWLLQLLPLIIALFLLKWKNVRFKQGKVFAVLFFSSFLGLTVVRFLADPDFIMDWTGFVPELQMGAAFLAGSIRLQRKFIYSLLGICSLATTVVIILLFDCSIIKHRAIQWGRCNDSYKNKITAIITRNVPKLERVFLSGSAVFWINENNDIPQIRGGNDSASVHPWWAHAAYQIREGTDPQLAAAWLRALGAAYVLVHHNLSEDPFHDFKNSEKYKDKKYFAYLESIGGDELYQVKRSMIGRIASDGILRLNSPSDGADKTTLYAYVKSLREEISLAFPSSNTVRFRAKTYDQEIISLAVTYDPRWKILKGKGLVTKDAIGNLIIIPEKSGDQIFLLRYMRTPADWLLPLMVSVILFMLLTQYREFDRILQKLTDRLHLGLAEDENEY